MKTYITAAIFIISIKVFAQIDSCLIYDIVENIKTEFDHKLFWDEINRVDQMCRGVNAIDSIDKINLLKSVMYFNKFGYPNPNLVDKMYAIESVYTNNKFPQARRFCFPIIFKGYNLGYIDEHEYRNFFIRNIYRRIKSDDCYKTDSLEAIYKLLNVNFDTNINIHHLFNLYDIEEKFLKKHHKLFGKWGGNEISSSIVIDGKKITKKVNNIRVIIFQDEFENYYFRQLNIDGSHYPQKITLVDPKKMIFNILEDGGEFLQIDKNGDLKFIDKMYYYFLPKLK